MNDGFEKFARRRALKIIGTGLAVAVHPIAGWAQEFPSKLMTLIVPFAAGGPTDVTARLFAKAISDELKQQVVVDNRPGAGGLLGGGVVARATPDGYTLLWGGTSTLAVAPSLYTKMPYDPFKSFQPVSRALRGPLVLVVNSKLQVNTLSELITLAKAKPGQLNFGSAGAGSIIHLTGELLKSQAKIDIHHIPYKGNAQVLTDLAAGVLDMAFIALGHVLSHLHDPNLRAIAISSLERNPLAPNLPTLAESGLPGFESMEWFGLVAPRGIPPQALERLNMAFRSASEQPQLRESIAKLGYTPIKESPEQFYDAMRVDGQKWRTVVTSANIQPH